MPFTETQLDATFASTDRYRIHANICIGDDIYRYKAFTVRANSPKEARAKLSNDWNIDSIRKMKRSEA